MNNWILLAFLAPLFWSLANYVDKFVISRYLKGQTGVGALVIFTGLTGFLMAIAVLAFGHNPFSFPLIGIFWVMIAGAILVASFIPYLQAIQIEDSSVVVPLYQLIPVLSYILAFIFLGETLTGRQLFAGALVIVGAIMISVNPSNKFKINVKVLGLMAVASLGVSVNSLMFKYFALENADGWTTAFWEYVGSGIFSVCLFIFVRNYRNQFKYLVRLNGPLMIGLNVGGEVLNLSAKLLMGFATLSAPIALVSIINGIQPFIIFVLGLILTLWIPHIIEEKITPKYLLQRGFSIFVIFVGIALLLK